MITHLIRKLWFTCLCLTSLVLTGCFHVPNEDWLPSKNNNTQNKDYETEEALNYFIEGINKISSEWNSINIDEESEEIDTWEPNNDTLNETSENDDENTDDKIEN